MIRCDGLFYLCSVILFPDNIAMRGERLELLVNKTENLSANSVTFRTQSRHLQRSLFWKNIKLYLIITGIIVVSHFYITMFFLYKKSQNSIIYMTKFKYFNREGLYFYHSFSSIICLFVLN